MKARGCFSAAGQMMPSIRMKVEVEIECGRREVKSEEIRTHHHFSKN
jgi:hypothetical protein